MLQCSCSGGSTGGGGETKPPVTVTRPDRETTFISKVEFRGLNLTDHYEYDRHGNISKRIIGGKSIYYTYDDIDRLVREDNAALNKTYFYEYDDFGNIEKITTYNYTAGNSLTGGVTKTYSYDSSKRLISVTENGVMQSISGYDALGNPASYKGNTLTWTRGRMLASCGNNSYLYDMDGVRQEKTVNGVVHTYYTDGTKIIAEKVGEKVFEYYYDAQGIVAFKYDGAVYYFKKNLMGDIDRIYDANKNLVAEYKYDAWGNHRVYTGTGIDITDNSSYNNSVAKLNPFRYRGYYYDTETGLYYLNSRYYDPSVGRFINADDISYIQPTDINGLNLFAYCGNNPVMFIDSSGLWPAPFIYRGYKIMFHPPRAGRGQQYHVHVDGKGKHFAQNIDGSPHDGLVGVPPKDVRDEIEKRTGGKWKWQVSNYVYSNYSFPNVLWTPYLSGNLPKMFIFPVNQFKISGNLWLPLQNEFSMNIIDPNPIGPDFSLPVFPYPNQGNTNGVIVGGGLIILILILLLIPGPQPI